MPRRPTAALRSALRHFLASEATGGLFLIGCAALALAAANSPLRPYYFNLTRAHVAGLSVVEWVNDALMAVFFLLVGLEIKRELLHGRLRTWRARALPGFGALGGMIVPACIYAAINLAHPDSLRGWAVPAATDIAFALGVLSLLGDRVPASLKVLLTALAVLDDLGAVVIIALFYSAGLSWPMLAGAATVLAALIALNRFRVKALAPYLAFGAILWVLVFRSGIHATVAGVLLAMTIPATAGQSPHGRAAPLERLEHALAPWVAFLILPIFGFVNAGVDVAQGGAAALASPAMLGAALGLFFGKQAGVFGSLWLAVRLKLAGRPSGAGWRQVYGVALLCGIGFTMSLFIGLLAFAQAPDQQDRIKMGVLLGSLLSAGAGTLVLRTGGRAGAMPRARSH